MTNSSPATTFVIFSRKSEAARVRRRLDDHGVISGVSGERGLWEVFGFKPDNMTTEELVRLVQKVRDETRVEG